MDKFKMTVLLFMLISMKLMFDNITGIDSIKDGIPSPNQDMSLNEVPSKEVSIEEVAIEEVALKEVPLEDVSFEKVPLDQLIKGPYFIPHDHPYLIQHIRASLLPPSVLEGYNMRKPTVKDPSKDGQPQVIRNILGEMKNGFFVEAGALDGEHYSNTLLFERDYGWSGLLVEADPKNMKDLMKMQRKAWTINTGLSAKPYPTTVLFWQDKGHGKIIDEAPEASKRHVEVQCVPLYSILMALNTTTIDYFSLDVEGGELDVLMTIPWDKLTIRTISVEFAHIAAGKDALRHYMESVGYVTYAEIGYRQGHPVDYIFHKKDVIPVIKAPENPIHIHGM